MNPSTRGHPGPSRHLVIAVHGIRTNGTWQEDLRRLVLEAEPTATFESVKYGRYSFLYFIAPWTRAAQKKRVGDDIRQLLERGWDRVDIVAHSFGSYLVANVLGDLARNTLAAAKPIINTVILCGSVLKPWFDWNRILDRTVKRLANYAGTKDVFPILAAWLVFGFGSAGSLGFIRPSGDSFHNQYPGLGHSGFFDEEFMRTYWVPMLTSDVWTDVPDARKLKSWHRASLEEKFARPVKFAVHLLVFLAIIAPGIFGAAVWYQRHMELPRNVQAKLAERSLLLMAHDRPGEEAARLAVASALLGPSTKAYDALLLADSRSMPLAKTYYPSEGEAVSTALSRDGKLLAIASLARRSMSISVVSVVGGKEVGPRLPMTQAGGGSPCFSPVALPSLEFTPKATSLLISSGNGTCVYRVADGSTWELPGTDKLLVNADETKAIGLSSLAKSPPNRMAFYDFPSHEVLKASPSRMAYPISADISSSGDVAVARTTGGVDVVTATGITTAKCSSDNDETTAVRFSPGELLAVGTASGRLCLLDVEGGWEVWHVEIGSQVQHIAFSPDGTRLVAQNSSGAATIRGLGTGARQTDIELTGYPVGISFAGNDHVVTANRSDDIRVWSAESGHLEAKLSRDVRADTLAVEGGLVTAVGRAGEVLLWDTDTAMDHWSADLGEEIVRVIDNSDRTVMAAYGRKLVKAWDAESGKQLTAFSPVGDRYYLNIESVGLSPDGHVLSVLLSDGTYEFHDVRTGKVLWTLPAPSGYAARTVTDDGVSAEFVALMPSVGPQAVMQICDGEAPLVDTRLSNPFTHARQDCEAASAEAPPLVPNLDAKRAKFSPDGAIVAAPVGSNLILFETRTGRPVAVLKHGNQWWPVDGKSPILRPAGIRMVAFTGDVLVTVTDGGVARTWDYRKSMPEIRSERLLPGETTVTVPSFGKYLYLEHDQQVTVVSVDDLKDRSSTTFKSGRDLDFIVSFPNEAEKVLVVSHDEPRVIDIGEGAINVPYYVEVYDKVGGARIAGWTLDHPVRSSDITDDGHRIVIGDSGGVAHIYDLPSGVQTEWFLSTISASHVAFGPKGKSVVASVAPSGTWGGLVGTRQIFSRYWQFNELVQHVCRSLSANSRDLSDLVQETEQKLSCPPVTN